MSDAKHTPGPWRIEKEWSNGCEVGPWIMTEPDAEGKRRIVAKVGGAPYLETDKGARVYANANILAAAPDLLAACEVVEWFGQHWDGTRGYCPCCGRCEDSGHDGDCALGNAIAKARPKPPPA